MDTNQQQAVAKRLAKVFGVDSNRVRLPGERSERAKELGRDWFMWSWGIPLPTASSTADGEVRKLIRSLLGFHALDEYTTLSGHRANTQYNFNLAVDSMTKDGKLEDRLQILENNAVAIQEATRHFDLVKQMSRDVINEGSIMPNAGPERGR